MGPRSSDPPYVVSVRELCRFAAKAGDLDRRFTPSPTAEEGQLGHRRAAARRGADYRSEVRVEGTHRSLAVRGRAGGFDAASAHLEEFKTHRGDPGLIPANHRALHWAQAQVYGWLLCQALALPGLRVSVVYLDIDTQAETPQTQSLDAATLRAFFESLCERFIDWADAQRAHRAQRDAWLATLAWPFADFRAGQRTLAEAAYNAARSGRTLLAQAPTGIGKTLATLFPMLKAMPGSASHAPLDKLFYLTAKSTGRQLALDALAALRRAGPPGTLRVVSLVARDKACEHPDRSCHGESCPLARGFWDRLPAARAQVVAQGANEPEALRRTALQHSVCPYYLAQEMTRWADVVVADYNHLFDLSALLHALTLENEWRVAALVDEAHNLVARARDMYSVDLDPWRLKAFRQAAPAALKRRVDALRRAWAAVDAGHPGPYAARDEVPTRLVDALRTLVARTGDTLAQSPDALPPEALQFHFDALAFLALAEAFDTHSQFEVRQGVAPAAPASSGARATLGLRNVVPAPFLKDRLEAMHTTVLFSATLAPADYHCRLLGLPESTVVLDVASPFHAGQLDVRIAADVSTRYGDRSASLARVARLIAAQYRRRPGNYLAFFSSFDYLDQVVAALREAAPEVPVKPQRRGMSEAERAAYVESFEADGAQVGFAVLGGAFGEGIDLPGRRLIGAFVATLGLPQVNPVNEAMRVRMGRLFGDGHAFAYLYPGLQKVVQAAGRVIRTPQDEGTLLLIDDRFDRPEVRALLPAWWQPRPVAAPG